MKWQRIRLIILNVLFLNFLVQLQTGVSTVMDQTLERGAHKEMYAGKSDGQTSRKKPITEKKTRAQNTARLRRVSQSVGDVMLSFPPWGKLFRGKRVEPHSTTIITTFPPPSIRFQWVLYYCFHTLGGPYWLYYENKVTNQGEFSFLRRYIH